jgi:sulfide:quinone oxidoreductase
MARVIVMGAGLGGVACAYEMKKKLGKAHEVTVVGSSAYFEFTPSNPWIMVGWRTPQQTRVELAKPLAAKDIRWVPQMVEAIDAPGSTLRLADGSSLAYDYLVITTGPKLAFEEVPGLGPKGHTQSVCTHGHALQAWDEYQKFVQGPGPVIIGAVQGASCYGPAYETAMILDTDLRRRKIRDRVPMTYVTAEPYIGHLGLGGVGDSKGMLESELRNRHIKWITNAKTLKAEADALQVEEYNDLGEKIRDHSVENRFAMMLPPFRGQQVVAEVDGLTNPLGFITVDDHQRSTRYPNIFAAGVAIALPPVEVTPVPTGTPKTGYMIESMVTAIVHNVANEIAGRPAETVGTLSTICLADMGDTGAAFVAIPQIPPRNVTWSKKGKWVHYAKIAFEKYFMRKMKTGNSEPIYEKYVLKALGITRV